MNVKAKQLTALRSHKVPINRWSFMMATMSPPTPQEAIDGGTAYEQGLTADQNPYQPGTCQHEDWAWGFDETQYRTEYASEEEAAQGAA
jgi:hypothetical protein